MNASPWFVCLIIPSHSQIVCPEQAISSSNRSHTPQGIMQARWKRAAEEKKYMSLQQTAYPGRRTRSKEERELGH